MTAPTGRTLAVIPARGGSRGLPGKHLRLLGGRPLIAYTIQAALDARRVDDVLVSTDDPKIQRVGLRLGADAPFLRPPELATDDAPTAAAIWHAVTWWEQHRRGPLRMVVVLQPTSPLRPAAQIDAAIHRLDAGDLDSVVSVAGLNMPVNVLGTTTDGGLWSPLAEGSDGRRQTSPEVMRLTGGIYATLRQRLTADAIVGGRIGALVVDEATAIDVDTGEDLAAAKRRMRSGS